MKWAWAEKLNQAKKYMVSTTPAQIAWGNE